MKLIEMPPRTTPESALEIFHNSSTRLETGIKQLNKFIKILSVLIILFSITLIIVGIYELW